MNILNNQQFMDNRSMTSGLMEILFKSYPDGILYKSKDSKKIIANKRFYDFNLVKNKPLAQDLEFFSKENAKKFSAVENRINKDRQPVTFKTTSRKNHSEKTLSITALPVINQNEYLGISYIVRDITEDEQIKERFFLNNYQLHALLENVPKLIYMKDINGNYITGTKYTDEFVREGKDIINNILLNMQTLKDINEQEDKTVIKKNTAISTEKEIRDINGRKHWYQIYKAPINDYDNNVIGLIVMIQNIDDSRMLEAQRETFVASLGHDLKNPTLAQIRAVELLLKGDFGNISDSQREILEMILDSCKYMSGMLGSLLATYRNERGVVKLNYEDFSLADLVLECVDEMVYVAKNKQTELVIKDESCQKTILGDKIQIKRVIMNLLSNGIKYAFSNSAVNITIYNEGDYTCFKFENNSPFIPPEKQQTIFAQYVSFAGTYKELGIGLGLYTSQKIIEAHGGKMFVKSFKDDRNIFGFKLYNKNNSAKREQTVSF